MKSVHARVVHVALSAVFTLLCVSVTSAQPPAPRVSGFVNANIGLAQPMPDGLSSVASSLDDTGRNEVGLRSTMKRSPVVDLGGGVLFRNRWMLGASFDRSAESAPGDVSVTLDHPLFHPTLTASRLTEDLERIESGVHISAGYRFPITRTFALGVFGGPSYLTRRQQVLSDISVSEPFDRAARSYSVIINSYESETVRSSAWGYHLGADGSYFFSRYVGIGAQLRYTRATFDTENLLQSDVNERAVTDLVDAGGLRFAAGVRLRF